jgi:hypothetical protein
MIYDKVYVGTSLSMLFYINATHKKEENFIILNKEDYYGGAWYTKSNSHCLNFDQAGHFIIIRNFDNLQKVLELFKNINIKMKNQSAEIKNENYKFIHESIILYPEHGWNSLTNALVNNIGSSNIFLNNEVVDINAPSNADNIIEVTIKGKNEIKTIRTRELFLPSYIKLNNITINGKEIKLHSKRCITYHVILYCKIDKNKYDNSFHGFYNGDSYFDRLTSVCNKNKMTDIDVTNQLLVLRVSRNFKDSICSASKDDITKYFYKFISKHNIILPNLKINDVELCDYEFCDRQNKIEELITNINFEKTKINLLNTTDVGSLIERII